MKRTFVLLIVCLWLDAIVSHAIPDEQPIFQPKPVYTSPLCPLQCRQESVYNVPHFHNCFSYYRCWEGIAVELECPDYHKFDHVTLECRTYDEARCLFDGPILPELE